MKSEEPSWWYKMSDDNKLCVIVLVILGIVLICLISGTTIYHTVTRGMFYYYGYTDRYDLNPTHERDPWGEIIPKSKERK